MSKKTESAGPERNGTSRTPVPGEVARWETEGGAVPEPVHEVVEKPSKDEVVERRQDAIMTVTSVDGRPPEHTQRRIEWKLVVVALVLIVAGVGIAIAVGGVSLRVVGFGLVYSVLLLLLGAGPVVAAGLLRGKEHREAHKDAEASTPRSP